MLENFKIRYGGKFKYYLEILGFFMYNVWGLIKNLLGKLIDKSKRRGKKDNRNRLINDLSIRNFYVCYDYF